MKIAVIPARGGSKRIPGKNIRKFHGKPIIAYSIETALDTNLFDQVIVSTDDSEVASVAKEYGADVPFTRPASLADDHTGTNEVVKHAIAWYQENNKVIDYACCIYATAPLIQKKYLAEGYDKLLSSGKQFAFSVTSFPFPVQRALRVITDESVEPFWPAYSTTRSQDLEEAYHDAGQFYWGTTRAFLHDVALYSSTSVPVILPRYLVQDIDTPEDWRQAELMYAALKAAGDMKE